MLLNPFRFLSAAPSGYAAQIASLSPIAYWTMDEPTGSVMNDSSGNGRHGTYGARATLGVSGVMSSGSSVSAQASTNVNAMVGSVADSVPLQMVSNPWSMVGWFYSTQAAASLLSKERAGVYYPSYLVKLAAGKITCELRKADGAPMAANLANPATSNDGSAHMWAVTYDGTTARLFADSVAVDSAAMTGDLWNASALPVGLACSFSNGVYDTNGLVGGSGHISLHSIALSAPQVAALYAAGTA